MCVRARASILIKKWRAPGALLGRASIRKRKNGGMRGRGSFTGLYETRSMHKFEKRARLVSRRVIFLRITPRITRGERPRTRRQRRERANGPKPRFRFYSSPLTIARFRARTVGKIDGGGGDRALNAVVKSRLHSETARWPRASFDLRSRERNLLTPKYYGAASVANLLIRVALTECAYTLRCAFGRCYMPHSPRPPHPSHVRERQSTMWKKYSFAWRSVFGNCCWRQCTVALFLRGRTSHSISRECRK